MHKITPKNAAASGVPVELLYHGMLHFAATQRIFMPIVGPILPNQAILRFE